MGFWLGPQKVNLMWDNLNLENLKCVLYCISKSSSFI